MSTVLMCKTFLQFFSCGHRMQWQKYVLNYRGDFTIEKMFSTIKLNLVCSSYFNGIFYEI